MRKHLINISTYSIFEKNRKIGIIYLMFHRENFKEIQLPYPYIDLGQDNNSGILPLSSLNIVLLPHLIKTS